MKISKIAFYLIVLPVLVIVVASSLFLAFFDANDYKQDLSDYVKQNTGRSLTFKGDAKLMLYPAFGMRLGTMEFSNAAGFGSTPMLSVDEVSISVDVKSILMLEPKVSQLILSELTIDLQKNSQGISNWDDLIVQKTAQEHAQKPQSTTHTQATQKPHTKNDFEFSGAFDGIQINNARVSWHDARTKQTISINDLDFTTGKITPAEAFPLSLQLVMQMDNQIQTALAINSQVFFDIKKQTLNLQQLDVQLNASGTLIPADNSNINVTASDVLFDINKQLLNISKLELNAATLGGFMQKANATLTGNLNMDLNSQNINMSPLQLNATLVDNTLPKGKITTHIASRQLNIALTQRKINLNELQLSLNNTQFKGAIHISDYAQPAVRFDLSSPNLDLDELLNLNKQTSSQTNNKPKPQQTPPTDTEIVLPTELLRQLDLSGTLNIAQLKAMNVKTRNNQLNISAQKGLIHIKPLALDLYDGNFNHQLTLDVRQKTPKFNMTSHLKHVQIGDLLIDFMQLDKISGAATMSINLTTQGSWLNELKQNLNGDLSMRFADGALKGFNLRHLSEVAKAKLSGSSVPEENLQETDFTELKLSGAIKKGIFYSDDLSLKSPLIRVGGKGQANLNDNTVDYTVNAKIIGSLKGQSGEGPEARGLLIPVRIFGSFAALKTDVLLDNMLKQQAAEKLAKSKAALKQKQQQAADALARQKAELKAQQQAKIAAKKQALKLKQDKLKAKQQAEKQKIAAQQAAEKQKLQDKAKAAEEAAKKNLENKLKGLFN